MTAIKLENVTKSFGTTEVLHGISLDISAGELVVFVGPSGCGKSTLLRTISGLESPSSGDILMDRDSVLARSPKERGVAMVFQNYALYPHKTVFENLAFNLKVDRVPKPDIEAKVLETAKLLHIDQLLDRRPASLSGGQSQRVAIGRAMVREPSVFLFDEPLSNLDAELRVVMRGHIAQLHASLESTMIYVTHDQVEAMTLADRIVVLRDGHILQFGTPIELYNSPINKFVAGFIGSPSMNFVEVESIGVEQAGAHIRSKAFGDWHLPEGRFQHAQKAKWVGVRPEHLVLAEHGDAHIHGTVDLVERLGSQTGIQVTSADGAEIFAILDGDHDLHIGATAELNFDPTKLHFFDRDELSLRKA